MTEIRKRADLEDKHEELRELLESIKSKKCMAHAHVINRHVEQFSIIKQRFENFDWNPQQNS